MILQNVFILQFPIDDSRAGQSQAKPAGRVMPRSAKTECSFMKEPTVSNKMVIWFSTVLTKIQITISMYFYRVSSNIIIMRDFAIEIKISRSEKEIRL